MTPLIRKATERDVSALLEIERASFSRPHWTANDFLIDTCLVAEIDGEVAGLLVFREIYPGDNTCPPEREILNVAVAPRFRRQGVAISLLRHLLTTKAVYFLEVRESNSAARKLYQNLGFVEISQRSDYYREPTERAIVMQMKWC